MHITRTITTVLIQVTVEQTRQTLLDLDKSKFVFLSTILDLNIELTVAVTFPHFCRDDILLFCVGKIRCVSINVFSFT